MKMTMMLPMNENDKSERIEWLLCTMNCAQKQLTTMSGKLGRSARLKSAGRESQFYLHQKYFFALLIEIYLFPRVTCFSPRTPINRWKCAGISGHNWRKLGGLLYDACGGLFAPGLPVSPIPSTPFGAQNPLVVHQFLIIHIAHHLPPAALAIK